MTQADITIVGQGTVSVAVSWSTGGMTGYKITATPANGWRFDHFEWTQRSHVTRSSGDVDYVYDYNKTANPFDDANANELSDGSFSVGSEQWVVTIENAKAVFVENHGHGIIYSPTNRRVVYDTESRKLMYYP